MRNLQRARPLAVRWVFGNESETALRFKTQNEKRGCGKAMAIKVEPREGEIASLNCESLRAFYFLSKTKG